MAGLIDGEGCYTIRIAKHHKASLKIEPYLFLSMKTGSWISKASNILETYRIGYNTSKRHYNQTELRVGNRQAKNLMRLLLPYAEVKKPVMEKVLELPSQPTRNRYTPIKKEYVDKVAEIVDEIRRLNAGKNRKHKWNGALIRAYYQDPSIDYKSIEPSIEGYNPLETIATSQDFVDSTA